MDGIVSPALKGGHHEDSYHGGVVGRHVEGYILVWVERNEVVNHLPVIHGRENGCEPG